MTGELGPTARSLVAGARAGIQPDAGAAARVRARIAASVGGAGAVVATTTASKATGAIPAIAGTSITVKVAAALALVGAAILATTIVRHRDPVSSAPVIAARPSADDEPRAELRESHVLGVRPDLGRPKADCPKTGRPGPDCPSAVRPNVGHAPKAEPPSLAREVELIDRAMAALRLGNATDALASIEIYDAETDGHGQLAEDGAAIEIEALCQLQRSVAEQLDTFDQRWPSSAQRERLTAACKR